MNNCTVIIPTYNRPAHLKRILDYYITDSVGLEFIVADSSRNDNQLLNQKTIDFFSNYQGFKCIRYSYNESIHFWEKLADVTSKVKTKYCVICADDDFAISRGILESVNFLENNPDYSLAHGKYLSYYMLKEDGRFYWKYIYPHDSIVSDSAEKRFIQHFTNYLPTIYAVHRTSILQRICSQNIRAGINLFLFGELMSSLGALIMGKMKTLNILYAMKQIDSSYASSWPSHASAEKEEGYLEEYDKFKQCLIDNLAKTPKDHNRIAVIIDESMKKYRTSKAPLSDFRMNLAKYLVGFAMRNRIPHGIYDLGKSVYRFLFPSLGGGRSSELDDTALAAYNDSFKIVRDNVLSHKI